MLSIIIPTLNEENYLPLLLESIKKQNFNDYEIIVADAGSTDKTLEIAKRYGCITTAGGLPAKGKNKGAGIARGNLLFFLDADVILPEIFFEKSLNEFKKRNLKIASFCLLPLKKSKSHRLVFNLFYNFPIVLLEKFLPHAATGILIEKEIFKKISGFDEEITLAEDHNLAREAKKLGDYGILKSSKIFISERRFEKDGWLKTALRYLFCELHMIFIGPLKSDIIKYEYDHYSKNKKDKV
jgi:glycosyltransferase involved in cell wall biosynthesis